MSLLDLEDNSVAHPLSNLISSITLGDRALAIVEFRDTRSIYEKVAQSRLNLKAINKESCSPNLRKSTSGFSTLSGT